MCEFIAGSISGACGIIIGHPIDTIKLNQQTTACGVRDSTQKIMAVRGIKGYFRGMAVPLVTNAGGTSIFFGLYSIFYKHVQLGRKRFEKEYGSRTKYRTSFKEHYWNSFIAGTVAGGLQVSFGCPIDLIKVKLQSASGSREYKGPIDCIRSIYASQGTKGFYKGVVPMLWRDGPGSGCYMASYEIARTNLHHIGIVGPIATAIVAGGLAGIVSWWPVIPFDVVKSRIQTQDPDNPKYFGTFSSMKKIYQSNCGLPGLFKGFWVLTIRAFPVNAIIFMMYEQILQSGMC